MNEPLFLFVKAIVDTMETCFGPLGFILGYLNFAAQSISLGWLGDSRLFATVFEPHMLTFGRRNDF
jgi:hypothetical protein